MSIRAVEYRINFEDFLQTTDSKKPGTAWPTRAFIYCTELLLVTAFKAVYAAAGIHQLVFAGIKRMGCT